MTKANGDWWKRIIFWSIMGAFTIIMGMTSYIQAQTDNRIDDNKIMIEKLDDTKADKKYMDEKFDDQKELTESGFVNIEKLIREIVR